MPVRFADVCTITWGSWTESRWQQSLLFDGIAGIYNVAVWSERGKDGRSDYLAPLRRPSSGL
jgi:hypothetical protein